MNYSPMIRYRMRFIFLGTIQIVILSFFLGCKEDSSLDVAMAEAIEKEQAEAEKNKELLYTNLFLSYSTWVARNIGEDITPLLTDRVEKILQWKMFDPTENPPLEAFDFEIKGELIQISRRGFLIGNHLPNWYIEPNQKNGLPYIGYKSTPEYVQHTVVVHIWYEEEIGSYVLPYGSSYNGFIGDYTAIARYGEMRVYRWPSLEFVGSASTECMPPKGFPVDYFEVDSGYVRNKECPFERWMEKLNDKT